MRMIDPTAGHYSPMKESYRKTLTKEVEAVFQEATTDRPPRLRCTGMAFDGGFYGWELSTPTVSGIYMLTTCPGPAELRLATDLLEELCEDASVAFIVEGE